VDAAVSPIPDGDRAQVGGVFNRVRRDRQVSNLLYTLLGIEDEHDPRAALDSTAASARLILETAGPAYRVRVVRACQLLTGLVLDVAENVAPFAEPVEADDPTDRPIQEIGP
jgi:hypothetical protein